MKKKILLGQELEDYLSKNGQPDDYNPWFKMDKPHLSGSDKEEYWYGFRCFNCHEQDMGKFWNKGDMPTKHESKMCSRCFYSLPNLQM